MQAARARVIADGFTDPALCLQHGNLIESLAEIKQDIRILVIGARGKDHQHQPDKIGAKLEAIIRGFHGHILVAYEVFKPLERVMLAYDGSESGDRAIAMIAASPLYRNLDCHLVCVNKSSISDQLIDEAAEKLKPAGWAAIRCARLQGKVDRALCDYQRIHNIDLTVMGAFSHTRLHDLLLGSFTHKMLLHTRTPLLLLR